MNTTPPDESNEQFMEPPGGWFPAYRSEEAEELWRCNRCAFYLLYVIAKRAQWKAVWNRFNLQPGQALIGDVKTLGMTPRQYRTAKQVLEKFDFATFKTTNKGTIAKLINPRVFGVSAGSSDKPNGKHRTSTRQAPDKRPTTTKKAKKAENSKNAETTKRLSAREATRTNSGRVPSSVLNVAAFANEHGIDEDIMRRWIYLNNKRGWLIEKSWQMALRAFAAEAGNTGGGYVPERWTPIIEVPDED